MPSRLTISIPDDLIRRLRRVRASCLMTEGRDLPASHLIEVALLRFLPSIEVSGSQQETARRALAAVASVRPKKRKVKV